LLRTLDVMIVPLARTGPREPLTLALAADSDPVWSPDGDRVLFRSLQDGTANLYARRVHDRNAKDEYVMKSELDETPTDWRSSTVLFTAPLRSGGLDVWQFNPATREIAGIATTGFNESDGRLSPDGRWVAYVSDESGRPDIYAEPYPEGDRVRVSFGGGAKPRWSRDGRAIYFLRDGQIMRAEWQAFSPPTLSPAEPIVSAPGVRDFDVAHRSDRLLLLVPAASRTTATFTAIVDWRSVMP
jgi:eukaryotic-like serine/threonine-protein kinase